MLVTGGLAIRLSRVHFPVTALGPGIRLGIWVQGCHLACAGCMSRDTWDAANGRRASIDDLTEVWRKARDQGATGLTVSGGEPAEQADEVAELVCRIRQAELIQEGRPRDAPAGAQRSAPLDVLVFSGLDEERFRGVCPALAECADAAMLGKFDITQPQT